MEENNHIQLHNRVARAQGFQDPEPPLEPLSVQTGEGLSKSRLNRFGLNEPIQVQDKENAPLFPENDKPYLQ